MREADVVRLILGALFLMGFLLIVRLHRRKIGRLLMLIGCLHVLGGTWVGREPLARIFREGLLGEADSALGNMTSEMDKELVFWFLLWGVLMFIFGQVVSWMERQGKRPAAYIGWELVAMSLLAIALYPKGGFWFVLIPAFLMIRASGKPVE
jgi:Family of unknown function (DUF6463)